MKTRSRLDLAAIMAIVVVVCGFLGVATLANADLISSRAFLFMDEMLVYDGIRPILHPGSWKALLSAVIDGGDQRYGRILWNLLAVVSFIPDRIAGVPGQIFASRELQPLLLAATYVLLAVTFVKQWIWRAVLVAMLCAIPWSVYYSTALKPEPLQLFFLAVFFWLLKRQGWRRPWSWIFLGLAFGTKISVAPVVGVAFALALLVQLRQRAAPVESIKSLARVGVAFVVGWFAAVPILPLIPLRPSYLDAYLEWTFRNSGHPADDASLSAMDWLSFLASSTPGPRAWVVIGLLMLLVVGAVAASRREIDRWSLVPWMAGLLLLAPIMLVVKRLWGFYLHPGMVLLLVGAMSSAEALGERPNDQAAPPRLRWVGYAFLLAFIPLSLVWGWPSNVRDFLDLSHRTEAAEFQSNRAIWEHVNGVLAEAAKTDSAVTVFYEPHLFPPEASKRVRTYPFWGPFKQWDEGWDFVVMRREDTPEAPLPPPTSAEHDAMRQSHELFRQHVAAGAQSCAVQPCYEPVVDPAFPELRVFRKRPSGTP